MATYWSVKLSLLWMEYRESPIVSYVSRGNVMYNHIKHLWSSPISSFRPRITCCNICSLLLLLLHVLLMGQGTLKFPASFQPIWLTAWKWMMLSLVIVPAFSQAHLIRARGRVDEQMKHDGLLRTIHFRWYNVAYSGQMNLSHFPLHSATFVCNEYSESFINY